MNNRVLFILMCSWSLFIAGEGSDNPLKQVVALRKRIAQERLRERCIEYVRKHYQEKISTEYRRGGMQRALGGASRGALMGLVSCGLGYAFLADCYSLRDFVNLARRAVPWSACVSGIIEWWIHRGSAEFIVLNRELENLERQEAVSTRQQ